MAANKSVTVLTPNGRRQNVKVSPNSTMLEVLEEACKKHNFNPDEYDLKHYNKIIDVNLIFRYANISNNALLEMVTCKNPRKVSNITICFQLESGNRLTGEFPPNTNIEKILKDLNIEYNPESAVIIYTQREIFGKDFATVTLRSLGLGSGKALLRLLHRDLEKIKEQAHVYIPPQPKVSKTEMDEDNKPRPSPILDPKKNKIFDPISVLKSEKENLHKSNDVNKEKQIENKINNESIEREVASTSLSQSKKQETPMEVDDAEMQQNTKKEVEEEPQVEILGERSALLFNQTGARASHYPDNIDDEFFELTVKDAKTLLRDVKKMQTKLQDSPLLTASQRELEKEKTTLNYLHKYQKVIIRIQFPNQLVLQGIFGPLETVQTIKDFVKTYLENPETDFVLYTAPPRCDLKPEERLFDCELVPSAIVYYSGSSDLKPEIKSKLTDPSAASFYATKIRLTTMRQDSAQSDDAEESIDFSQPSTSAAVSISRPVDMSNGTVESQPGPSRPPPQKSQMPKWLKLSK